MSIFNSLLLCITSVKQSHRCVPRKKLSDFFIMQFETRNRDKPVVIKVMIWPMIFLPKFIWT